MTGHVPKWLPELMRSLSFVFPFETRLMYFYVSWLDRDRAMQRLIDLNAFDTTSLLTGVGGGTGPAGASGSAPGSASASGAGADHAQGSTGGTTAAALADRLRPRLDKRKKTINRALDLFKQADQVLTEFSHRSAASASKPALLEIQYENEVGTGLGPTLEFYALVSIEMRKCAHEMWRGDKVKLSNVLYLNSSSGGSKEELFFHSPTGLFPAPVSLYIKGNQVTPNALTFTTS